MRVGRDFPMGSSPPGFLQGLLHAASADIVVVSVLVTCTNGIANNAAAAWTANLAFY